MDEALGLQVFERCSAATSVEESDAMKLLSTASIRIAIATQLVRAKCQVGVVKGRSSGAGSEGAEHEADGHPPWPGVNLNHHDSPAQRCCCGELWTVEGDQEAPKGKGSIAPSTIMQNPERSPSGS